MEPLELAVASPELQDRLQALDVRSCLGCGACASGCPIPGTPGMEGFDPRVAVRLLAMGREAEAAASPFPWVCTSCGRCSHVCPMGIDLTAVFSLLRSLVPRANVPGTLEKGVASVLETGNTLAIPLEDFLDTLSDIGGELAEEECPGFYVPVDKQGADLLVFLHSKEVFGDFDDLKWWWRIFYNARENWTVPSRNWEAEDWGLFTGNPDVSLVLARRKLDLMRSLGAARLLIPDCGGGSYGCRMGLKICALKDPSRQVDSVYFYDYLLERITSGRLRLDPTRNAGRTYVWHDACKHGRELERHFGKGYYDEPRAILAACVGQENVVAMDPDRANNFCCGAGGGNWPMPFEKESAAHGRFKVAQLEACRADVVVVGCANCRDQLQKRLPRFYPGRCRYEVKYLWQLVAETMIFTPWSQTEIEAAQERSRLQQRHFQAELDGGF